MSEIPIQETHIPSVSANATPTGPDPDWEDLRQRVLVALDEDPVNTALLARHLDHRDTSLTDASERILATLTGMCPGAGESRRLLEEAMTARERWSIERGRPVPLRLALLDLLLAENRRRPDPWLAELRLSTAPSTGRVADPTHGVTSQSALTGALQSELRRAQRFGQECALVRLGLDDWTDLVWRVGAAAAERFLGAAAMAIKNEIRDVDWTARTPDNDMILFLADTGRFGALLVANRVADKLARLTLPGVPTGEETRASIGLAAFPSDARFGWELMAAARNAMFRARADGGKCISDQGAPPARCFQKVAPESVRIVVRALNSDAEGAPSPDHRDGILFASPVPYDVGNLVELECIEVAGQGRTVFTGRVVRLEERRDGEGYDVGVACHLIPEQTSLIHGRAARQSD
ncbi:MAG: diguanylate cyclase [Acidobacteria bacterium]|nr:diguanylate cyclase [Acidobacteriota bacterium]MCZ6650620.1 diguanylate cyclase [Acidobacteriota bacterium]MCZ6746447.1 diguanylate cyclase [Acidobacteriota bacterium]